MLNKILILFIFMVSVNTFALSKELTKKLQQYQVNKANRATNLATKNIDKMAKKQKEYYKLIETTSKMMDKRSLLYIDNQDLNSYSNRRLWRQWNKVYKNTYSDIQYIPYSENNMKMIAEMRVTEDYTNLDKELKYFKDQGYNTVLASWHGGSSYKLYTQIIHVKSRGFKVWFTYSGSEDLKTPVLIEINKYSQGLQLLATICDGYIVGWRRTSLHLWLEKSKWMDYTLKQVRLGNPNIYIFGEIYYGYNGLDDNHHKFSYNIPENASGAIVVNLGNLNNNQKGIYNKISNKVDRVNPLKLFSVIVGEKPYYASRNNTHKTQEQNRLICKKIEQRVINAGFAGTITLTGDGSDGHYQPKITDDVAQSEWHIITNTGE